ncbi:MAG TPA: hypothetical protein VJ602_05680, partial [Paludibacter sp.]|nr:hypothetical protein [Paludibacter sp.]
KKLIVTLLRKDIQELEMITEGFMEMSEYPLSIIQLARQKTEDIQAYIKQLSELIDEEIETSSSETTDSANKIPELIAKPLSKVVIEAENKKNIIEVIEAVKEFNEIDHENGHSELITEKTNNESTAIFANSRIEFTSQTRNELLSKADNTISSILDNKKNIDIKEAINIGDRFRFQRELFANGEDMNETFNYINQLSTFEEVKSFLQSRYGWDTKNETAEDFLQIVRRRFL